MTITPVPARRRWAYLLTTGLSLAASLWSVTMAQASQDDLDLLRLRGAPHAFQSAGSHAATTAPETVR